MRELERIQDQIVRAHRGEAWHGPSLLELLEGVDETTAEARPLEGAHSIRELVAHVTAWQEEAVRRLQGRGRDLPPAEDWPDTKSWAALVERLKRAHDDLLEATDELEEGSLDRRLEGRRESAYVLLHGIVQHNLYHAGQIAILKKTLATAV
jgi:uncharacterized damage-inducible protein DinB